MNRMGLRVVGLGLLVIGSELQDVVVGSEPGDLTLSCFHARQVAAHEQYFHTYFIRRREAEEKKNKKLSTAAKTKKSALPVGDVEGSDDEVCCTLHAHGPCV